MRSLHAAVTSSEIMISVIIPAFNEASVIEESLRYLTENALDGSLEVIVVCNGCSDRTEAIARSVDGPIRVLAMEVASKTEALNLGDDVASGFPRFYVDADVRVDGRAIREVARQLDSGKALAAAPSLELDLQNTSRLVRAYYAVWTALPYFDESMVGSGVYALSEEGRCRFDRFPDIIADDEFIRRHFDPKERMRVEGTHFTIRSPKRIRGVLREKTRSRLGVYQLDRTFPSLGAQPPLTTRMLLAFRWLARVPGVWTSVPVYGVVTLVARLRARLRAARSDFSGWERDVSSRP